MNDYFLILTLIGLAAFGTAWMPAISKLTGISYSVIYLIAGILIYYFFPNVLPNPDAMTKEKLTVRFTEMIVIITLMGKGLKIDRSFKPSGFWWR